MEHNTQSGSDNVNLVTNGIPLLKKLFKKKKKYPEPKVGTTLGRSKETYSGVENAPGSTREHQNFLHPCRAVTTDFGEDT